MVEGQTSNYGKTLDYRIKYGSFISTLLIFDVVLLLQFTVMLIELLINCQDIYYVQNE